MAGSVLVTGGAGFIGSHIVADLAAAGYRVTVFDNFSSGLRENLGPVIDDVEIVEGDVLDAEALTAAARGKDVLSHQAAQLEITKCLEDPLDDMRTNLVGTINVLEAARAAGVARVVNASSACIYGQAVDPPSDEDAGPHNPNWSYGASKLAAEKYAQIFAHDYGFAVHSLRYG
ncbi:MAG: NAD-dependent epimerase/dehydratase family protein, partial [Candidatus Cybelea sp.]